MNRQGRSRPIAPRPGPAEQGPFGQPMTHPYAAYPHYMGGYGPMHGGMNGWDNGMGYGGHGIPTGVPVPQGPGQGEMALGVPLNQQGNSMGYGMYGPNNGYMNGSYGGNGGGMWYMGNNQQGNGMMQGNQPASGMMNGSSSGGMNNGGFGNNTADQGNNNGSLATGKPADGTPASSNAKVKQENVGQQGDATAGDNCGDNESSAQKDDAQKMSDSPGRQHKNSSDSTSTREDRRSRAQGAETTSGRQLAGSVNSQAVPTTSAGGLLDGLSPTIGGLDPVIDLMDEADCFASLMSDPPLFSELPAGKATTSGSGKTSKEQREECGETAGTRSVKEPMSSTSGRSDGRRGVLDMEDNSPNKSVGRRSADHPVKSKSGICKKARGTPSSLATPRMPRSASEAQFPVATSSPNAPGGGRRNGMELRRTASARGIPNFAAKANPLGSLPYKDAMEAIVCFLEEDTRLSSEVRDTLPVFRRCLADDPMSVEEAGPSGVAPGPLHIPPSAKKKRGSREISREA